ncbi:hypothetical protein BDV98DRAFT_282473 [Pterulicium gracile]|uniref:Fork-head domain-containing protein n=1 Tax=Pterulicium gracile TaxID=1884261 RepID=A0A5C3QT47_9AGAR|nr:hypothetical protein BDV98DRAFT_282473 [Pterula gracilis]
MSAPSSPVSQLLKSLGISKVDLQQRSSEMRAFLSADASFVASSSGSTSKPCSTTSAEATPPPLPATPASTRKLTSMEEVMERKSRQCRKDRKMKHQQRTLSIMPPSPTPSNSSSARRVKSDDATPVNQQYSKYYREHTLDSITSMPQPQSTPSRLERQQSAPSTFYSQQVSALLASQAPVTPRKPRPETIDLTSPLPPSSPPAFTPQSSPVKPLINFVSSPPRPIPPPPSTSTSTPLPYALPLPPYSKEKPGKPYAALIGQAITASPQHRLTLQEIYDYMSTVWPYFQRRPDGGTTTWMNSVRHVLSTTTVFRKCVRERRVGRSLWAIWDEDMECFEGGGYKKKNGREPYILPSSPVKGAEQPYASTSKLHSLPHYSSDVEPPTPSKPKSLSQSQRAMKRSTTAPEGSLTQAQPKVEPSSTQELLHGQDLLHAHHPQLNLASLPPGFQITQTANGPALVVPIFAPGMGYYAMMQTDMEVAVGARASWTWRVSLTLTSSMRSMMSWIWIMIWVLGWGWEWGREWGREWGKEWEWGAWW